MVVSLYNSSKVLNICLHLTLFFTPWPSVGLCSFLYLWAKSICTFLHKFQDHFSKNHVIFFDIVNLCWHSTPQWSLNANKTGNNIVLVVDIRHHLVRSFLSRSVSCRQPARKAHNSHAWSTHGFWDGKHLCVPGFSQHGRRPRCKLAVVLYYGTLGRQSVQLHNQSIMEWWPNCISGKKSNTS